jgi:hypothetical protein
MSISSFLEGDIEITMVWSTLAYKSLSPPFGLPLIVFYLIVVLSL